MASLSIALDQSREAALLVSARASSPAQREEAFSEVFEAFRKPVLALCFHLTGRRADAEDAAQDVFLVVFRGLPKFRGESRLSTWIYRIAIRTAFRTKARLPKTEPLLAEPAGESKDPSLERERRLQVRTALARLSADHRTVLALFSLDGLSHREIAATLGIPEGTVWSRLHLARKKLAEELRAAGY